MKYLISKPARNVISSLKNKLLGIHEPAAGDVFGNYFTLQKDSKSWAGMPTKDDFNWSLYNLHYRDEMKIASKMSTLNLGAKDYAFEGGRLIQVNKNILPLHQNAQLLYETILQLNPESVFELGIGNGIHLNNLKTLSEKMSVSGIDRSEDQIKYLHETYPKLNASIRHYDATKPFDETFPKVDVAYTQAVIMHIKTGTTHLIALANLFNISKKQVVLMENWKSHNFMKDVRYLFNKKLISWENLYIYYRVSKENPDTRIMICSQYPLEYAVLEDYREMERGIESQGFFYRLMKWIGVK
ncbi:MAG: class I SAM-dependent methyltransferase [Candidatus Paceibacterota bacterium]|jgi:hypothetical protein